MTKNKVPRNGRHHTITFFPEEVPSMSHRTRYLFALGLLLGAGSSTAAPIVGTYQFVVHPPVGGFQVQSGGTVTIPVYLQEMGGQYLQCHGLDTAGVRETVQMPFPDGGPSVVQTAADVSPNSAQFDGFVITDADPSPPARQTPGYLRVSISSVRQ